VERNAEKKKVVGGFEHPDFLASNPSKPPPEALLNDTAGRRRASGLYMAIGRVIALTMAMAIKIAIVILPYILP
jgi:hypothetical protein